MKNVRTISVKLADLADQLGYEVTESLWPFIARRIAGGEVRFDEERGVVTHPDFIPVDQMVQDVLEAMSDGRIEVRHCVSCGEARDINRENGIFGDQENLERFVCEICADRMSAREFYEKHLRA